MSTHNDSPQTAMAIAERHLTLGQVRAAMAAMMEQVQDTSETPVCMAIVDASGNMEAFAKMDHARVFTRRHAVRKAYTSAILGMNRGLRRANIGQSVSENGDPMVTYEQGGVVITQDGAILGGIGVGGLRGHNADEDLAKVGLAAMGL